MNAEDRIKYASITQKINKKRISELTEDEYDWLKYHPNLISEIRKHKQKNDIMNATVGNKNTIEEILFDLDLSDRMYR
jgi:hypothetical protein